MSKKLTDAETKRRIKLIEKYLKRGHPPAGQSDPDKPNAITMMARDIGITARSAQYQFSPGGDVEARGYQVRWDLYSPRTKPPVKSSLKDETVPMTDHQRALLRIRRLEDSDRMHRAEKQHLMNQVLELEDVRRLIGGLDAKIGRPTLVPYKRTKNDNKKHTALVHISDIHDGEVVKIDALNGLNSYNSDIAKTRLSRLAHKSTNLLTKHFTEELEELVVMIAGDLISGAIHEELMKTDDATVPEAVRHVVEVLAGVIQYYRDNLGVPIRVICVPGNHGRSTKKNEWKGIATSSFDILICYFIEREFKNDPNVRFFYPESGEALFSIYRFPCLCLHGHNMGIASSGGGVFGPGYAIIRGGMRTQNSYDRRGIRLAYIFTAHYHTTLKPLPFLYANGSVIGPNEYSMHALKAVPEVAKQNLFLFHPVNGLVTWHEVFVGDPSEGSIYGVGGAPNPDADLSAFIYGADSLVA